MTCSHTRPTLMRVKLRRTALIAGLFSICMVGCDKADDGDGNGDGDDGTMESPCGDIDRADEFGVGLSKTGEMFTVTFMDATPAPPIRDFNTWTLKVEDGDGDPVDELEWEVFPWMPDHGHGTPTPVVVSPTGEPGEYELDPLNLFMAGLWTIDLVLAMPEDGGEDTVQFAFCIE